MTQWVIFTQLPNPFAVLYEGESKKSETGIALNTVDPDWQHPWASFKLGNAESKSPSTLPIISVFHGVSEEKRTDPKYLIGKTESISVDKHLSDYSNHQNTPELRFKGHSLFEPFSGKQTLLPIVSSNSANRNRRRCSAGSITSLSRHHHCSA